MNHTIIVLILVLVISVDTMIQTTVYVVLVLAGDAVFAVALARTAFHEPYGVGDELHWGAEDRCTRLGARRTGSQGRRAI